MTKTEFNTCFIEFIDILEHSGFRKEEFLFHSQPYINGFFDILRRIDQLFLEFDRSAVHVFDLGCGTGLTTYLLACMGYTVQGVDIYDGDQEIQNSFKLKGRSAQECLWRNLAISAPNLSINFFDGLHIPHKDRSFDLVLAHAVIEHIPSEILNDVLDEITRVIIPGGYFAIARTPNKYAITEFLSKSHDIKFSKEDITRLLDKRGFEIKHHMMTDFFPENAPFAIQSLLNAMLPITHWSDKVIACSPLAFFSHHHFIIAQKNN